MSKKKEFDVVQFRDHTFGIRWTFSFLDTGLFKHYKYQDRVFIDLLYSRDSGNFEERCKYKNLDEVEKMVNRLRESEVDHGVVL